MSTEKEGLEAQVLQLKEEKAELQQNNSMQLSQINTLLREKVGMQSDSITQREVLLTTERNIAYVIYSEFFCVPLKNTKSNIKNI